MVAELAAAGNSQRQIAEVLNVSRTTVSYWMKQDGIEPSRQAVRRLSFAEIRRTVELYQSGMSIDEVAAALTLDYTSTHYRLKRAGVLRSRSEAAKLCWQRRKEAAE